MSEIAVLGVLVAAGGLAVGVITLIVGGFVRLGDKIDRVLAVGGERAILTATMGGEIKALAAIVAPLPAAVVDLTTQVREVRHGSRTDRAATDARIDVLEQRVTVVEAINRVDPPK